MLVLIRRVSASPPVDFRASALTRLRVKPRRESSWRATGRIVLVTSSLFLAGCRAISDRNRASNASRVCMETGAYFRPSSRDRCSAARKQAPPRDEEDNVRSAALFLVPAKQLKLLDP